jgi:hypothetical protein
MPGAARPGGAPPYGVTPWCGPLASSRCLSAPNIPEKIGKRFLEFFEKLYFRGIFKNWQMIKSRKPKDEMVENKMGS